MKNRAHVDSPTYAGVNVDNPRIVAAIKECAKRGVSKEETMKVVGMPMEVVDKHYNKE